MSLAPLNLIDAHPWQRVAFTTYAVSLSFFEAVILDRLVRGGGSQALILADVRGYRASLSEQGAQRVGKEYEIEPVAVSQGVFHPKLTVLAAADECHLLVGSGNLTFNGWGGNCEILEHLHPSFAAGAIADAADFFERMPGTPRIRQSAGAQCAAIAADLRRSIEGRPRTGDIRLIHNLNASIEEQVAQMAADLGGASRLVAMAPFWDGGAALDSLCSSLGLSEAFVHAHAHGCVEGSVAANWPRSCRSAVQAVRLGVLDGDGKRRLHAKALEILCRRGRIVVSGSANGTAAALGPGQNVEACVARLQRERMTGWTFSASEPPEPQAPIEEEAEDNDRISGVLRAVLEADQLTGEVLTPRMSGAVSVFHVTTAGPEPLAETALSAEGSFRISAPALEEQSWSGGRLVIRVRAQDGRLAEGFVSVASFADITRRAGLLARRLFALLAGNETPADVAAIMSWFHEDPERLAGVVPSAIRSGGGSAQNDEADQLIPVAALRQHFVEGAAATMTRAGAAQRNWSRFIDHILRAFRSAPGAFAQSAAGGVGDDDDDDDQSGGSAKAAAYDPAIEKSLAVFERLFGLLLKPGGPPRNALIAFDLTQYVCARLRPDAGQAKAWLGRLIRALLDAGVPPERRSDVAAAVMTLLAMAPETGACRWARGCLLRLETDFSGEAPPDDGVQGFLSVLPPQNPWPDLWPRLRALRTHQEQVRSYLRALADGRPSDEYPDLRNDAREPVLEKAITSEAARKRVVMVDRSPDVCPRCHIMLPQGEAFKLRTMGVAMAKGCCSRVVIWPGN